jgi:hypothetical protein
MPREPLFGRRIGPFLGAQGENAFSHGLGQVVEPQVGLAPEPDAGKALLVVGYRVGGVDVPGEKDANRLVIGETVRCVIVRAQKAHPVAVWVDKDAKLVVKVAYQFPHRDREAKFEPAVRDHPGHGVAGVCLERGPQLVDGLKEASQAGLVVLQARDVRKGGEILPGEERTGHPTRAAPSVSQLGQPLRVDLEPAGAKVSHPSIVGDGVGEEGDEKVARQIVMGGVVGAPEGEGAKALRGVPRGRASPGVGWVVSRIKHRRETLYAHGVLDAGLVTPEQSGCSIAPRGTEGKLDGWSCRSTVLSSLQTCCGSPRAGTFAPSIVLLYNADICCRLSLERCVVR